ncbi:MAG: CDP-alcohol phosphatidyltransferase family protein [Candidatus Aminicenantes bacterium]|jgi:cardiolipin synthase
MAKNSNKSLFTAPNILSMLRILLIPVFITFLIQHKVVHALLVFLFAALTDLLDGIAARVWKQKTELGTYLDPAADKLLMASSFIVLSLPSVSTPNTIPFWLMLIVILRDLYIVSGTLAFIRLTRSTAIKPSILGKASTVLEMGLLILVLIYNALGKSPSYLSLIYVITMALAVLSAAHYTHIGLRAYSRIKSEEKGEI